MFTTLAHGLTLMADALARTPTWVTALTLTAVLAYDHPTLLMRVHATYGFLPWAVFAVGATLYALCTMDDTQLCGLVLHLGAILVWMRRRTRAPQPRRHGDGEDDGTGD